MEMATETETEMEMEMDMATETVMETDQTEGKLLMSVKGKYSLAISRLSLFIKFG